jgi:hypothetical protein
MKATTHNRIKLIITALGAAVAVATPALLFAGAGSAQAADVSAVPYVSVGNPTGFGAQVTVTDNTNGQNGQWGNCTYTSWPTAGPAKLAGAPKYTYNFWLPNGGTQTWNINNDGLFPAFASGSTWHSHIFCTDPSGYSGAPYDGNMVF